MTDKVVKIDGSYGEGGGQILRTAIALSCVTGIAVEVDKIRANRPRPGLAMQHMKGIEAAKLMSSAEVEGLRKGSTRVLFKPGKVRGGKFRVDIGTAGSISLVLQVLIPIAMSADRESEITVTGGTDVKWSPPVDYLKNVTLKAVERMGGRADVEVVRRGYYPEGGGRVTAVIEPSGLHAVEFEVVRRARVKGISHCSNLPRHVAERQAKSAAERLSEGKAECSVELDGVDVEIEVSRGKSTGSGITLWCDSPVGGSALGEKGKRAEIVGREAAEALLRGLKAEAAVDEWAGDQLMVFAALAKGVTRYTVSRVTKHQISNAYVINKFFDGCVKIDEDRRFIAVKGAGIL